MSSRPTQSADRNLSSAAETSVSSPETASSALWEIAGKTVLTIVVALVIMFFTGFGW